MASASKEMTGRNPAEHLTDDIILQILSRLPAKSICRCKCVSRAWRDLISHRDNRKKLAQTLAGFFYHTDSRERFPESARHFTNVTGRGAPLVRPSLSFLPGHNDISILDSCYGLLLCRRRTAGAFHYVVCNPATEEWMELPESSQGDNGLEIYSSKNGEWAHRDSGWSADASLNDDLSSVFFNGRLHVFELILQDVLVVDTEGKVWRTISVPDGSDDGFIGQSQGCLFYLNTMEEHDFKLSVYVLEDYATDEWTFKHSVRTSTLLGTSTFSTMQYYSLITIHPDCNRIFFISDLDNTLRCYDMDRRQVHVIHNMGCDRNRWERSLPYVPLFMEAFAVWAFKLEIVGSLLHECHGLSYSVKSLKMGHMYVSLPEGLSLTRMRSPASEKPSGEHLGVAGRGLHGAAVVVVAQLWRERGVAGRGSGELEDRMRAQGIDFIGVRLREASAAK
ncbi:hypothetical protein EJB05_05999, partial [Eragrostis curvula]